MSNRSLKLSGCLNNIVNCRIYIRIPELERCCNSLPEIKSVSLIENHYAAYFRNSASKFKYVWSVHLPHTRQRCEICHIREHFS
jgi:predicted transcriptional regulator